MKKVLVLATTFPRWRGDSEPPFVWELTRRLQTRGFACQVLVPHAAGAQVEEEWDGVRIRRFPYAPERWERVCYDGGALPNLRASWIARIGLPSLLYRQRAWIRKILAEESIDLVHSHWVIPQGFWAVKACRGRRVPLLLTAHAGDVFGLPAPLRWAARKALQGAAAVTVNSRATSEAVREIHSAADPIRIPMGVDLDDFEKASEKAEFIDGAPAIVAVGRFAEKKGFHFLIEAAPAILSTLPEAKIHLVGFGPWEDRLRANIGELGLESKVQVHGSYPHEKIASVYAAADLFVQPSARDVGGDREGLGVTILEAMASGVPVVASRSGGIVDVIEDRVSGLLVEPGDSDSLARGVIEAWESGEKEKRVANAREKVRHLFSWESVADRFGELYERVIANTPSSPT